MTGYILVNLRELIEQLGEDKTKIILPNFICPQNKDVDDFLKFKSMEFSKQGIAITYLVFAPHKGENALVGYFTLATKVMMVYRTSLSKTLRKRITKFALYDEDFKRYVFPAPLIGQLSKNFLNGYDKLITGDELLKLACDKVKAIQGEIGGRVVYLECEDNPKLIDFYSSNGFVQFGKRKLDRDEVGLMEGEYLIQLLKYLKS